MKQYSLNELTASRLIYDRNPPRLFIAVLAVIIASMVILVCWSVTNEKIEVAISNGSISEVDKTYIAAPIGGRISDLIVEEGMNVSEGDTILIITNIEYDDGVSQNNLMANYYRDIVDKYTIAKEKLLGYDVTKEAYECDSNNNPFGPSDTYYNLYYSGILDAITDSVPMGMNTLEQVRQNVVDNSIMNICTQIESNYLRLRQYTFAAEQYSSLSDSGKIKATTSGTVHYENQLAEGLMVEGGNILVSISPNVNTKEIKALIPASQRAFLWEGEEVIIKPHGVSDARYGHIRGTVEKISSDSTISGKDVYYLVIISLKDTELKDKDGKIISIVNGMGAEISFVYQQDTYMDWALKKIGIK